MSICRKCEGTGFLNLEQIGITDIEDSWTNEEVFEWIEKRDSLRENECCSCHISAPCNYCIGNHDVQVCDCCGDGVSKWKVVQGHHSDDEEEKRFIFC